MNTDGVVPVAYAMHASPKRYALLLGAGISVAAGLPSGKEVTAKMIREIALSHERRIEGGDDAKVCIQWFTDEFDEPPTFDKLMAKLGIEEENRRETLQPFILPTDEKENPLPVKPTPAHRMIAELVKDKIVSLIITTNFDHLLERAIEDVTGIRPIVVRSDSNQNVMSIFPDICRIVKVNGDFENLELKITPEDLASYDVDIKNYIQRICAEYGLVICGWSGDYDYGLREILSSANLRRYPTFWCLHPDAEIPDDSDLIKALKPIPIEIESADQFFTDVHTVVSRLQSIERVQPLTVSVAIRKVTDALQQPKPDVILSQLIHNQTDIVLNGLAQKGYVPAGNVQASEIFNDRVNTLSRKTASLAAMLATLSYYDDNYADLVYDDIERLVNVQFVEPFAEGKRNLNGVPSKSFFRECLYNLRLLPALIVIYSCGIAATKSEHFNSLEAVFTPKIRKDYTEYGEAYFEYINIHRIFRCSDLWVELNRHQFDQSEDIFTYTYETCHGILRDLIPGNNRYSEAFDIFEYLYGLAYLSTGIRDHDHTSADIDYQEAHPLFSRFRKMQGNVLPDSIRSYVSDFGEKIEGTRFFGGDPQLFERCNRKFAEIYGLNAPNSGIMSEDVNQGGVY
ncbi:SIR2 family protein [Methanofollis aquaemaris]|nr:SIR2 family protein [Methanofollis aquaemaris]